MSSSSLFQKLTRGLHVEAFHQQIRLLRWAMPLLVLALTALHHLVLRAFLVHVPVAWHNAVEILLYGLTGSIVAWIGLTWIAEGIARRAEAEAQLRAAYRELEANHQKLLALHELGHRVTEADHEETILELAAQGAVQLTGARAASVVTFDDERERLKLDVTWNLSDRYLQALRARIEEGIPVARCRECTTLHTQVASDCPLFVGLQDHARAEGIASLICRPLKHEQERIGILSAYFPVPTGPPEDHIRLLNILSDVTATALDSFRRRTRQVGTLRALDHATQSTQALNDLAAQVLKAATAGWDAQAGGVFLYEEATQIWTCHAQHNLGSDLTDPHFQFALRLVQQAQALGEAAFVSNPDLQPEWRSAVAVPLMTEGHVFGALFLASKSPRPLNRNQTAFLHTMGHQIALALRNAQLCAQTTQVAVLQERYRLAREIHDGLSQTLGFLGMQAERVEGLIAAKRYQEAAAELAQVRQSIRAAYVDVREAIDGLRLSISEPGQLADRLAEYVDEFAHQSGIAAHFSAEPKDVTVAPETGLQLLRIAQEALTNVRKHAQASNVQVVLRQTPTELELTITDDGRGFPEVEARFHPASGGLNLVSTRRAYHSHGLASMRERAQGLGGTFTVATGPGQGTRITVTVPLQNGHLHP